MRRRKRVFFRGLRWRLTVYYTLVMLAALVVLEIAGLIIIFWISAHSEVTSKFASLFAQEMTFQAAAFLSTEPPDIARLQDWLEFTLPLQDNGSIPRLHLSGLPTAPSTPRLPRRYDLVAVADAEGRMLAANLPPVLQKDVTWQRVPFRDPVAPEASRSLLAGALHGEAGTTRLPDGVVITAWPVRDNSGAVVGALYLRMVSTAPGGRLWRIALTLLGIGGIVFALVRGILGMLFGFLTAHWLTRRLRALAEVTDTWGRGDFSVQAHDPSNDEIGQLARQLNRMAEQLQSVLEMREQLATLEERNRLARDLHDSVKQQVFATAMQVGAARALLAHDPARAAEHLIQAETLARQAQQELTALLRQLRPVALVGKGLAPALRDYVSGWSRQTGISVDLRVHGERRSSPEVEQALYRVAQEALSNVARHSGTNQLEVTLTYDKASVTLRVTDYGCGFDTAAAVGKGMGLTSMAERVAALGGQMEVLSRPGQGTTVQATLPTGDSATIPRGV